ncbi:unnamed protein product [Pieris macdunnoughi]|uniref:Uncharacterized protein n=1 Tax=Pieris macdunnoughi TaxID=345717 RepID=A0A821RQI9_9NEOP|nr:unnamed protein product [Pieris macdunnoughi]
MGIVRGVPCEWDEKDILENIELPQNCGSILKVRRLNRKVYEDKKCPEYARQKSIKETMARKAISYSEASKANPPVSKSYADWNCRSINSKKSDLIYLLNNYKPFAVSLKRLGFVPDSILEFQDISVLEKTEQMEYGGVALILRGGVPFVHIPIINHSDKFSIIAASAAEEVFPIKSNSGNGYIPSPPWWDSECSAAIAERKRAEGNYRKNSTTQNFNILSNLITKTRKLLKQKRFNGWKSFCASISPDISPSEVWQNIRRFRSAFKPPKSHFMDSSTVDLFLDKLAPPYVPSIDNISFDSQPSPSPSIIAIHSFPLAFQNSKGSFKT